VPDEEFVSGSSAATVLSQCGLGRFSKVQLGKKLSGKIAGVSTFISELQEGLSGSCSPEDLETLLQLTYLHFTAPRADKEAFASYRERTRAALENRLARPEAVFQDEITRTMSQGHLRREPWVPETVDRLDLENSLQVYRERFADAGDFTFLFVGRFDPGVLEELACKYLAGLPSLEGEETWTDHDIAPPEGRVEREVREGQEPKAQVAMFYTGPFDWSFTERHRLLSMLTALNIRLRESIREDLGGTYSVRASSRTTHYPDPEYRIVVSFGCAPEQVDGLVAAVREQIEALRTEPVDDIYLTKIKQGQLRQRETDLERNEFWVDTLKFYAWHGEDPRTLLEFEDHVNRLSKEDIRETARKYFGTGNVATFTLLPEQGSKE
jgi:zinc protease